METKTLMDVGTGDGETIATMLPFFGNPFVYWCDPDLVPSKIPTNFDGDIAAYHESKFYDKEVDITTFFDSLACYNKEEGMKYLLHAIEKSKMVICWGPDDYYPYAQFKSAWHAEDFLNLGFSVYKAVNIHEGPPIKASGLLCWRIK